MRDNARVFAAYQLIEVTETWRAQRWSTTSHVFVTALDDASLVTYRALGTSGTYATSRGVRGREHLSRSQRKMEALRTGRFNTVEVRADLHTLEFFEPHSWARVSLGWDADWRFLGWYVNFEEPPRITSGRIDTMDLILDAVIGPDLKWRWKDRADFRDALAEGLLDHQTEPMMEKTGIQIKNRLRLHAGPFAEQWLHWRPADCWERPDERS